jgi:hypothetical protein
MWHRVFGGTLHKGTWRSIWTTILPNSTSVDFPRDFGSLNPLPNSASEVNKYALSEHRDDSELSFVVTLNVQEEAGRFIDDATGTRHWWHQSSQRRRVFAVVVCTQVWRL